MMLYVSGPYSAPTADGRRANIEAAAALGIDLIKMGHSVIVPHLNSCYEFFGYTNDELPHERWLQVDFDLIARCDAVVVLPNYENSVGTLAEIKFANSHKIPVWYAPHIPDLHPTEIRSPQQAHAFINVVMDMYRTHLSKNHDYSPANILATGEIGLIARLWDKVARLCNLEGHTVAIIESPDTVVERLFNNLSRLMFLFGIFVNMHLLKTSKRSPKHESVDDTLLDTAVYAVIGLLLRRGVWGR